MRMTTAQVANMVGSIGYPYAYYQFPDDPDEPAPNPPFICFFYSDSDDVYADNSNFVGIAELHIELYCDNKDFTAERAVESVLRAHGFSFEKSEQHIDTEQLYMTVYETEVIIQ